MSDQDLNAIVAAAVAQALAGAATEAPKVKGKGKQDVKVETVAKARKVKIPVVSVPVGETGGKLELTQALMSATGVKYRAPRIVVTPIDKDGKRQRSATYTVAAFETLTGAIPSADYDALTTGGLIEVA